MKEFYRNKSPPQFIRRMTQFKNNVTSDEVDYCRRNIQYRADIYFFLATDSVSVTSMTKRLTFFDKLSAFGKKNDKSIFIFYL